MLKIPKWLGDTMEVMFASLMREVTVEKVWFAAPELKGVRFSGDLQKTSFKPGDVIKCRVSETEFRNYTIAHFHQEEGIFEVFFYLHDKGPGSLWAAALQPGDVLRVWGPTGHIHYQPRSTHHFIFGDETSVGLTRALTEAALQHGQEASSLIEMARDWELPEETVAADMEAPAKHAISKVGTWLQVYEAVLPETTFYLTGRAKSIQAMRKYLKERGIASGRILTQPYWAEGKCGL